MSPVVLTPDIVLPPEPPEVLLPPEVLFPLEELPPDMVELPELLDPPLVEFMLPPIAPPVGDDPLVAVVYVEPAESVVVITPAAPAPEPEPEVIEALAVTVVEPIAAVPETDAVEPDTAPSGMLEVSLGGRSSIGLTTAERVADLDDLLSVGAFGTRFIGAIADTIAKVHVGAETGDVIGGAPQAGSFVQHVLDACFLFTVSECKT